MVDFNSTVIQINADLQFKSDPNITIDSGNMLTPENHQLLPILPNLHQQMVIEADMSKVVTATAITNKSIIFISKIL